MSEVEYRPPRELLVPSGGIEHHVADLTLTAAADVSLAALQAKLGEQDQWLPIDGDPQLPLRRLVEMNSTGPLRSGFGAWRDLLLGVQFSTASGKFISAGARTMKNVAGYDLTKFMVGQFGVFGELLTITTRAYKRPAGAIRARFAYSFAAVRKLLETPCRPHWAMAHAGRMDCGYLGDEASLAYFESNLSQYGASEVTRHSLEDDIALRQSHWLGARRPTLFRASVPPEKSLEFLGAQPDQTASADPLFGIIVGSCDSDANAAQLDRLATSMGGRVIYDDPQRYRSRWNDSKAESDLLQRIELAFHA